MAARPRRQSAARRSPFPTPLLPSQLPKDSSRTRGKLQVDEAIMKRAVCIISSPVSFYFHSRAVRFERYFSDSVVVQERGFIPTSLGITWRPFLWGVANPRSEFVRADRAQVSWPVPSGKLPMWSSNSRGNNYCQHVF